MEIIISYVCETDLISFWEWDSKKSKKREITPLVGSNSERELSPKSMECCALPLGKPLILKMEANWMMMSESVSYADHHTHLFPDLSGPSIHEQAASSFLGG